MIPEEQERPYVTWPKRKDQVTFSEIAILWTGVFILAVAAYAIYCEYFC